MTKKDKNQITPKDLKNYLYGGITERDEERIPFLNFLYTGKWESVEKEKIENMFKSGIKPSQLKQLKGPNMIEHFIAIYKSNENKYSDYLKNLAQKKRKDKFTIKRLVISEAAPFVVEKNGVTKYVLDHTGQQSGYGSKMNAAFCVNNVETGLLKHNILFVDILPIALRLKSKSRKTWSKQLGNSGIPVSLWLLEWALERAFKTIAYYRLNKEEEYEVENLKKILMNVQNGDYELKNMNEINKESKNILEGIEHVAIMMPPVTAWQLYRVKILDNKNITDEKLPYTQILSGKDSIKKTRELDDIRGLDFFPTLFKSFVIDGSNNPNSELLQIALGLEKCPPNSAK